MKRKIDCAIVTGASGFIGNYLVEKLLDIGITTYAILRHGSQDKLRSRGRAGLIVVECNEVDEVNSLIQLSGECVCFNLAWSGVAGARREDFNLQLNNVKYGLNLMEKVASMGCNVFIGVSSISEIEARLLLEQDGVIPEARYIYSSAKIAMDCMGKVLATKLGVTYINAQIANVYGEFGLDALILHSTIIKLLNGENTVFTEGKQLFDFIYVKDVVKALIALAESGKANTSYYVGSGKCRPLKEYLEYVGKLINKNADLGFGKLKGSGGASLSECVFKIDKLVKDTGVTFDYPFEQKIVDVIEWYRDKLKEG